MCETQAEGSETNRFEKLHHSNVPMRFNLVHSPSSEGIVPYGYKD
jgi:hypothetical protein